MRLIRGVRNNPLFVLLAVGVVFAVWVAVDLTAPRVPPADDTPDVRDALGPRPPLGPLRKKLPPPPDAFARGAVTPEALAKLKPGMSRAEVEEIVGLPPADQPAPATEAGGATTYSAAYNVEFDAPPVNTVRPIPGRAAVPAPPPSRTVVALEFDATRPGHPLVGVHYPDPLF